MQNDIIRRLEKAGYVKSEKTGQDQIERFLSRAAADLESARRNLKPDADLAYRCAYDAIRNYGEALILAYGYRASVKDHHKTVIEFVRAVLDAKYGDLIDNFDQMRRNRNELQYGGRIPVALTEAEKAIKVAEQLIPRIWERTKLRLPQKRFD
ncbi:MAG: HEPN domain-containing protein [Planctomycetes bacterium]|nr:HEPN domain-containing protein [Planctomycetota bacterium]